MNFSPTGSLLSKDKIIEKIRNSDEKHEIKNKLIEKQEKISDFTRGITVIMCYASWCGHCQTAKPIYDAICGSTKCNTNTHLCAIDCANDTEGLVTALNRVLPKIHEQNLITGYPTFIKFVNGKFESRYEGKMQDILEFILV